jgi:hypothetical protein
MPIPKLAMSLQKKVIDGCITPFSAVTDFRLFDLLKHITVANMYTTPMTVLMNKQKYEGLPDYAKKAIDLASGKPWGLQAAGSTKGTKSPSTGFHLLKSKRWHKSWRSCKPIGWLSGPRREFPLTVSCLLSTEHQTGINRTTQ